MRPVDFHQAPLLAIWEVTRACALACVHCRATAQDQRDPAELSLDEGRRLIDEVAALGTPLLVFTGGDPLQRDDLEDLIRHGKAAGLTVATIPAATPRLTRERIQSLRDAGVDQLALSLDGPDAATHDQFRKVDGTFAKVIEAAGWIREAGVALQINTVLGPWNQHRFGEMADLVTRLGIVFWEIFFLVPTGRGAALGAQNAADCEALFAPIHAVARSARFTVKVTEAQHYRRWVAQNDDPTRPSPTGRGPLVASKPVNAGNGFVFIDHRGEIQPSGFLPIDCGNLRTTSLAEVYRDHPVFRGLRDLGNLGGKCADCEHRDFCSGGSRARASAATGDLWAPDPLCAFQPAAR